MVEELWRKSAIELAGLIASKAVSSREVITSHIARIEQVNSSVNAITLVLAESALAAADKADTTKSSSPLHGVPFSIKENIDCVGSATTQGIPAMAGAIPTLDAPCVARMKAAGAIPLARTNMPEFGLRIATDNPLRGRSNNPFDLARTTGGSSGGEAAALATGMSPIGLGNDIGGSLRNPAYCCGITSLKPTTGRIPRASSLPPMDHAMGNRLMAVEGPMARTVADLKLAYRLLSGFDPRDTFSTPAALEGPPAPKRAAIVTSLPGAPLPAATVAAIEKAAEILRDQGWIVEEAVPPDLQGVNDIWGYVLATDVAHTMPMITPIMSPGAVGLLEALVARFDPAKTSGPLMFTERDRLAREWSGFFLDWPVVIGPIWADLPFHHDEDIHPATGLDTTLNRLRFITPGNLLGIPSVALPMGLADGLPRGVQIYAERWREDLCLATAGLIEDKVGRITPVDPKE